MNDTGTGSKKLAKHAMPDNREHLGCREGSSSSVPEQRRVHLQPSPKVCPNCIFLVGHVAMPELGGAQVASDIPMPANACSQTVGGLQWYNQRGCLDLVTAHAGREANLSSSEHEACHRCELEAAELHEHELCMRG
jgi:hypothetical protein